MKPWLRAPELVRACRCLLVILVFGVLPPLLVLTMLIGGYRNGERGWAMDFDGNFLAPARDILRGVSPYHTAYLEHVRTAVAGGHRPDEFSKGVFTTYPAPALLIGVPFTCLPAAVAEWLWLGLMVASAALALRIVGVRDWRVYGAALLTPAMGTSLVYGTVNCALMLALAAAWRWRDQAWRTGAALGALIALKLIFLPLLAWLLFTRRWLAAVASCVCALSLWLVGWAIIGFHGLARYPHVLSLLSGIERRQGLSTVSNALALGLSDRVASAIPYVLGACVVVALWRVLRRGGARADAHAFLLGALTILALSPIVWLHYVTLLLVPLAVLRPRLSVAWFVPCLLWLTQFAPVSGEGVIERIVFVAVVIGTVVLAFGPRTPVPRIFHSADGAGTLPAWR